MGGSWPLLRKFFSELLKWLKSQGDFLPALCRAPLRLHGWPHGLYFVNSFRNFSSGSNLKVIFFRRSAERRYACVGGFMVFTSQILFGASQVAQISR
jgi:hypothetical protein